MKPGAEHFKRPDGWTLTSIIATRAPRRESPHAKRRRLPADAAGSAQSRSLRCPRLCRPISSRRCTPIGARPIIFRSDRSICRTIRCSKTPLTLEHIKPRLLGHWGTTTGLNFLYVHLNRLINDNDLDMIYVIGPGHGGPGLVAHSYLEGSYTERYPAIERNRERPAAAVSPVLLALRHPQPRLAGNPRLDPRRRRARLFAGARLWRGLRQSGPDRRLRHRRRRGGDRRRWRRAGTPTSSSTPRATARCCRSCISTASRSPIRPCWRASAARN